MLSTPHLLVGAAVVKTIPNPYISLPLALLSHFALDTIPHWDGSPRPPFSNKTFLGIFIDYLFGASLVFILTSGSSNQEILWLGAFLGTAPDFLLGAYRYFETYFSKLAILRVPNQFHMGIQRNVPFRTGLLVTLATSLISILILAS